MLSESRHNNIPTTILVGFFMCSQFQNELDSKYLAKSYGVTNEINLILNQSIRPTNEASTIVNNSALKSMKWGINSYTGNHLIINARAESLRNKTTYTNILNNRCIIPANYYFEWEKRGKRRIKNIIRETNRDYFCFAGIYQNNCFAIITCEANSSVLNIHPRMPVILEKSDEMKWADTGHTFNEVEPLLQPYSSEKISIKEETQSSSNLDLFREN